VGRTNVATTLILAMVFGCVVALGSEVSSSKPASAHLDFRRHTSFYSYTDSACKHAVDPISIVFYRNATLSNVDQHASHHNSWTYHSGSTQYFYDHYCGAMDNQNASGDFWQSRYHMREWWNWDAKSGYYTLATPHHEDMTWCGHAVDGSGNEPPGGFVRAKWEIGYLWHNWNNGGGTHYFGGSQYWGNTQEFQQCDGDWASNDGWIDFVEIR
jgi:hypothetical protein